MYSYNGSGDVITTTHATQLASILLNFLRSWHGGGGRKESEIESERVGEGGRMEETFFGDIHQSARDEV